MRIVLPGFIPVILCAATAVQAAEVQPITLEGAVQVLLERALEGHPGLIEAEQRAAAAQTGILQAGALPDTTFALEAGQNVDWAPWEAGELTLAATQPLGRPTARAAERELARLEADRAALGPEWVRKRLALELEAAAVAAVHRAALARHWEAMAALAEQVESTVALKYRGGEAPYAEVLRARIETLKARNRLQQAARDRDRSRDALARLAGSPPEMLPPLPDQLDPREPPPALEACIQSALEASLALREAAIGEAETAARTRMAGRNGSPEWTVGLFVQRLSEQPPSGSDGPGGSDDNAWGASVEVAVPLFSREKLRAERDAAGAALQAAAARRTALERDIGRGVALAHAGLAASLATVASYESALLPDLEEAMRGVRDQYAFQQAGAADLFGIYSAYREARGEYLEALRGAAEARLALEAAFEPGLAAGPKGAD